MLHVHIGNIDFSDKFIVSAYLLGMKLEKDIYQYVPKSRRNNTYCTSLKKLPLRFENLIDSKDLNNRIFNYYNMIFKHLCGQEPNNNVNKNTPHPRGRTMGYDHSTPRYNWLNFIPAAFNIRGSVSNKTIEFRIHSGTSNFNKIKNWIKVCMAFVNYADNYLEDIINDRVIINGKTEPLTLQNIILKVFPKTGPKLNIYLEERKKLFEDNISDNNENIEYADNFKGITNFKLIEEYK